ncbi:RNA polymerase factor sigma-54 [Desulfovibrio mangrovi]|uniref:RNA polymerase factor sigma-54 n=1 Tax=Desulfovibrio mangrovi TaxID=2976983 RepID=UPI002245C77B|nr:RNA polymerase factor sigma-54 [Desulfovibrio mangrovi]UZP68252.1 RNA polymerase factor sigma-54 [Desulfovibrio mangrovi]
MALELRQQLKLSQQLVMTPQLQQAIKLLQLSRLELMETVQQELLENPFLEEASEALTPADATEKPELRSETAEAYDKELASNADWEDYLGDFSSTTRQVASRETEIPEEGTSFEARLSSRPSLDGHLSWQLTLSNITERQHTIGEIIIGNIGSNGYLHASLQEMAEMAGPDVETAEVEEMLRRIQRFDPVGVAARTPQECLLVQIEVLGYDRDPVLVEIVRDHLEDLEKRRYKPLCRKFRINMDDLREYLELIQTLDPMPGASFGSSEPQYVAPDVFVHKYDGEFVIILNEEGLPSLQLSDIVDTLPVVTGSDKDYFQEKMRSASWLIKSLHQRQRTLYKVMESIVKYQRGFFEEGVTALKPLILKDIADDIGMHESTVSRITTSKYVATPHGIFELKFFFNSAIGMDDGSSVGSESVKALIKQLIGDENPKRPLSDERIGEILKEKLQLNIARRTVAKYRTAMDIPSSSKRKSAF